MARKRMPDPPLFKSWDDANQALMEIAKYEIELAEIEGDMNLRINEIKKDAEKKSASLKAAIEEMGRQLKLFCVTNKTDFGKQKSKKLTFGSLGWRASQSITIKKGLDEYVIKNLRGLGMENCIIVKETINKNVLETYPEDKIVAAGATFNKKDTFWFETDKESLSAGSEVKA